VNGVAEEVASMGRAYRPPARSPIYNTPSREFSGLFNGLLKYMGWALAFCLVQVCSHVSMGSRAFFCWIQAN
jgi:hypothetical protein